MNFVDTLRSARSSRVAVLHEFWTQYDPAKRRIHAFFEGHEDTVFFGFFLREIEERGWRVCSYRCDGKPKVYEAFESITRKMPNVRRTLFFVDKDLDDILGIPWPTDPRVFVTDVYSIENYLATSDVLRKFAQDCLRSNNVKFEIEVIESQFKDQLKKFHTKMLPVMAWILTAKRSGKRPNLGNVDMKAIMQVSGGCAVQGVRGRTGILERATGVSGVSAPISRIIHAARELMRMQPKRVMRGKFEIWFFLEFWKAVRSNLEALAKEVGGKIEFTVALERRSMVSTLCGYIVIPRGLDLFLQSNLPEILSQGSKEELSRPKLSIWKRALKMIMGR